MYDIVRTRIPRTADYVFLTSKRERLLLYLVKNRKDSQLVRAAKLSLQLTFATLLVPWHLSAHSSNTPRTVQDTIRHELKNNYSTTSTGDPSSLSSSFLPPSSLPPPFILQPPLSLSAVHGTGMQGMLHDHKHN